MKHWEWFVTSLSWSFVATILLGAYGAGIQACTPAETKAVATAAPFITGALCALAADQGAAEPGWEIVACQVLDAKGGVTPNVVTIKLPKAEAERLAVLPRMPK